MTTISCIFDVSLVWVSREKDVARDELKRKVKKEEEERGRSG